MSRFQFSKGEVIGNRYTIQDELGAGAFGTVYKANSKQYGDVALKLMPTDPADADYGDLATDAVNIAHFEHPNIVRIYEAGLHHGRGIDCAYIAMEYVPGGTLTSLLESKVRLEVAAALEVTRGIAQAVAFLHEMQPPVLHGDLKPDNILVASQHPLSVKLGDFGLSKAVAQTTGLSNAAGTLYYFAPESLWGFALPASDVFAIGLILYRMIAGVFPFTIPDVSGQNADSLRLAIEKSRNTPPKPPSYFNPDIPEWIDGIVQRSLALNYHDRYRDAAQLLQALGNMMDDEASKETVMAENNTQSTIPVFGDPEYLELACSGSLSPDDVNTLWELYCDLESPVDLEQGGLFSIITMTGLTKTELMWLANRSFSESLFAVDVSISQLRILKDIGKLFYGNPSSERAKRAGLILYIAAIGRALDTYSERISRLSVEQLRGVFTSLLGFPYLPTKYRTLLSRAQQLIR